MSLLDRNVGAKLAGLTLGALLILPGARAHAQCWVCIDTSCVDLESIGQCGGASCTVTCRQFCFCRTQGSCGLCASIKGTASAPRQDSNCAATTRPPVRIPETAFQGLEARDPMIAEMLSALLGEFQPGSFKGNGGAGARLVEVKSSGQATGTIREKGRALIAYEGRIEPSGDGGVYSFRIDLAGDKRYSALDGTVDSVKGMLDVTAYDQEAAIAWRFVTGDSK
jgi:hypothetical protein